MVDRIKHPDVRGIRQLYRWGLIGVVVGVISGLVAVLFYASLADVGNWLLGSTLGIWLPVNGSAPSGGYSWSTDPQLFFLLPAIMVVGGLATGLLIWRAAPEVAGHGTDAAIESFHDARGVVRLRAPPLKFIASIFTIATGGSGGREGPTAQIGSGIGSIVARYLGLSTRERRVAAMAGLGSAIGAIFKAPFGAALLSAEILYVQDFEPEVIMPSIISSVISFSIFGVFYGRGPEFAAPSVTWSLIQLPLFGVLGVVAGLFGILYVVLFWGTHHYFDKLKLPTWAKPPVGVAIAGAIIVAAYYLVPLKDHLLAVGQIGLGYGVVQWLIYQGHFGVEILLLVIALIVLKIVATSLAIGTGGSGGVFGPAVVVGAFVGFAVITLGDMLVPSFAGPGDVAAFTIIGMMAFFGSVSKAPIATILMVLEMTRDERLLLPAMLSIFVAYYVAGRFQLYRAQVKNRLASPAHITEYFAGFLKDRPVSRVLKEFVISVPPSVSVSEAEGLLSGSPYPILAVSDGGRLVGELRPSDIHRLPAHERSTRTVRSFVRERFPVVTRYSSLLVALELMDRDGVDVLLVTDPSDPHHLAGVVTRGSISGFVQVPETAT